MDNRGKAAALVGLSAIGGILAYYGMSQYGNEKEEQSELVNVDADTIVNDDKKEESVADTVGNYLSNLVTGNKNIKLSVDETVDDKKENTEVSNETNVTNKETIEQDGHEDHKAKWSKYWSKEYTKQQTPKKDGNDDEASPADFN